MGVSKMPLAFDVCVDATTLKNPSKSAIKSCAKNISAAIIPAVFKGYL